MVRHLDSRELALLSNGLKYFLGSKLLFKNKSYNLFFEESLNIEESIDLYLKMLKYPLCQENKANKIIYEVFYKSGFTSGETYEDIADTFVDWTNVNFDGEALFIPFWLFYDSFKKIFKDVLEELNIEFEAATYLDLIIEEKDSIEDKIMKIYEPIIADVNDYVKSEIESYGTVEDYSTLFDENAIILAFTNMEFDQDIIGLIEGRFCYNGRSVEPGITMIDGISYFTIGENNVIEGVDIEVLILILIQFYRIKSNLKKNQG